MKAPLRCERDEVRAAPAGRRGHLACSFCHDPKGAKVELDFDRLRDAVSQDIFSPDQHQAQRRLGIAAPQRYWSGNPASRGNSRSAMSNDFWYEGKLAASSRIRE